MTLLIAILAWSLGGGGNVTPTSEHSRRLQTISQDEIREVVRTYIQENTRSAHEELELQFRTVPDNVQCRGDEWQLRVDAGTGRILRGPTSIVVELIVDGTVQNRIMVSCVVRRFATVLVATKRIPRHATIGEEDVRQVRMETTFLRYLPVLDTDMLRSLRSKRIITAGSILYEELFEPKPLVQRGDDVILKVLAGGVCLSTKAVAQEDGWKGDLIEVRREGSRVLLRGKVETPQTVAISTD